MKHSRDHCRCSTSARTINRFRKDNRLGEYTMKQIANFLLIGLVLLGIVVIYDGFFIVQEGRQVMITQFGKPIGEPKTEAGLYFKMPFLQQVNEFDKRIVIWNGEPNQIPTNDKTFVYLDVTARWRIVDALRFMQAVRTE